MILLTPEIRAALRANDRARLAGDSERVDPPPVVKLFNPLGAATWLASELAEDGDTLFGLADLGFGCPETRGVQPRRDRKRPLAVRARRRTRHRL